MIGPERLPRVARTAGVVVGRLQRYAATVRADIAREVELSELRRVQGEITDAARSFESNVRESLAAAGNQLEAGRQAVMTGPRPEPALADADGQPPPAAPEATRLQGSLFTPDETPPGDSADRAAGHTPTPVRPDPA